MRKLRFRKGYWIVIPALLLGLFASPTQASTYTVSSTTDIFFEITEPQHFSARAYAWEYGIDSMLWLYQQDNLITVNDDYFGLDSYISLQLNPGSYRLRTGVCCGDPNRWYGQSYRIETSINGVIQDSTNNTPASTSTTSTSTTRIPLPENSIWGSAVEGQTLQMSSPEGFIFSNILFASYGTPNGENGRWQISECHSENSIEILSNIAIGNSYFSLDVSNDVFQDPCPGVVKRLAVLALYSPLPTTTTSTTTTSTTTTVLPTTTFVNTTIPQTTALFPTTTELIESIPIETTTSLLNTTTTTTSTVPSTTTTSTSTTQVVPTFIPTTTTVTPVTTSIATPTTTSTVVATTKNTVLEIKEDMSQNELVKLVTNIEVLQKVNEDQAKEIFQSLDISNISDQEKSSITEAVQNAPVEVKEAFEEEINIYSAGFENYVPLGSEITVSERRTLIAVASIASAMSITTTGGSAPGGSGGGSGGSPGNSNSKTPSDANSAFKKEEEAQEDEEEAPEIEGPEGGDEENYTKNSIYKYTEDGVKKFSLWNFIKKFSQETASLAFTISSTVIVFATLSGETRRITLIATTCAFAVHYIYVMIKNDE